jgi:hypothetical protein
MYASTPERNRNCTSRIRPRVNHKEYLVLSHRLSRLELYFLHAAGHLRTQRHLSKCTHFAYELARRSRVALYHLHGEDLRARHRRRRGGRFRTARQRDGHATQHDPS